MSIREIFRQNLKYYRKMKGFTQEALSEKLGLNPKYITNIEAQSKFPSAETIDSIAEVLGIQPSELFIEQGCPVNTVKFDKTAFIEELVSGISLNIKDDIEKYLEKKL